MPSRSALNSGSSVPVTGSSTQVAPQRTSRSEIIITNDSDAVIYLKLAGSGAAVGSGIRLNPEGGSYSSTEYQGPVCAVHNAGGNKNLCVVEV